MVPKAGDELPTIVEEADGDAVPETDAQLPTVVEDAEAPDGDGEASDDSVEQALAKLGTCFHLGWSSTLTISSYSRGEPQKTREAAS